MSSSDPADVIDQSTGEIPFATVGQRTITVTVQQIESDPVALTATVNVIAAPVTPEKTPPAAPLASTGAAPTPALGLALLVALSGLGALLLARRRTVSSI